MTKARPRGRGICVWPGCGRPVVLTLSRLRGDSFRRQACSAAHIAMVAGDIAFRPSERHHMEQRGDLLDWIARRARGGTA